MGNMFTEIMVDNWIGASIMMSYSSCGCVLWYRIPQVVLSRYLFSALQLEDVGSGRNMKCGTPHVLHSGSPPDNLRGSKVPGDPLEDHEAPIPPGGWEIIRPYL